MITNNLKFGGILEPQQKKSLIRLERKSKMFLHFIANNCWASTHQFI